MNQNQFILVQEKDDYSAFKIIFNNAHPSTNEGIDVMSGKSPELETRISVVEVKVEDLQNETTDMKKMLSETHEFVIRTNGSLPRIEKTINLIHEKLDNNNEKLSNVSMKVKIIWAIFATIGGTVLVAALTYLFSRI